MCSTAVLMLIFRLRWCRPVSRPGDKALERTERKRVARDWWRYAFEVRVLLY